MQELHLQNYQNFGRYVFTQANIQQQGFQVLGSPYFQIRGIEQIDSINQLKYQQSMSFLGFPTQNTYNAVFQLEFTPQLQDWTPYGQQYFIQPNFFQSDLVYYQRNFEPQPSLGGISSSNQNKQTQKSLFTLKKQPGSFQCKKSNKSRKKENKEHQQTPYRNLKSNILKYFLKYISQHRSMGEFYCRNIQGICNLSYKQFLGALWKRVPKNTNYMKPTVIRQVCLGIGVPKDVGKVFRILFRKFMTTQFVVMIQHMKKIDAQAKLRYIQTRRSLMKQILKCTQVSQDN